MVRLAVLIQINVCLVYDTGGLSLILFSDATRAWMLCLNCHVVSY